MTNRVFAAVFCASLLAGCAGGAGGAGVPSTAYLSQTHILPVLIPPETPTSGGSPIKHVIVIIQENRTMDNMFNGFPFANTVTTGLDSHNKVVAMQPQGLEWPFDPDHMHRSLATEYNNGKMNGFDKDKCDFDPFSSVCSPPKDFTYSFVPNGETTFLWILGGAYHGHGYAIADNMFSNRQVPTFPGHLDIIAGQGPADDPIGPGESALSATWGCDSPRSARVAAFGKKYNDPLVFVKPCFDYQTLADLMDAKKVTWKYYTGTIGTVDGGGLNIFDAIKHIRYGPDWTANIVTPMTDIFDDIQHGTLPQVSFVTPPFAASDHAGSLSGGGPAWVASIYSYVTENKALYKNTAIFVTWDDSGGWYDHVAPPIDSFGPLGFRVPLLAMSPFTKPSYVSHKQHDFGSIVHFIEKNWGLGTLGQADLTADDLSDMFNYKQKPVPPVVDFGSFSRKDIESTYSPAYWRMQLGDKRVVDSE
jgi:phospholipase C